MTENVYVGNAITFKGTGFRPGENVSGTVHSQPVSLGSVVADAQGRVSIGWIVPANFEIGEHTIVLTGESSKRSLVGQFTVLKAGETTQDLAQTGATTSALWSAALIVGLIGAGIVIGNRRRAGLHG